MDLWIARDSNGSIFLHSEKPQLNDTYGYWDSYESFKLDTDSFPVVTFENSPKKVELKLIKE